MSLLFSLLFTSCYTDSKTSIYPLNNWQDFNSKEEKYLDYKINVSAYFDNAYIVIGFIAGTKNKETTIYKYVFPRVDVDYSLVEYQDSTGQQVIFDENNFYEINSTRTIKINYDKLDDETKNQIADSTNSFCVGYRYYHYNSNVKQQKVQYGDNLESLTF